MPKYTPTQADENIVAFKPATPLADTSERAALSCLLANFAILDAMPWREEMFFHHANKAIFRAIAKTKASGSKTDFFAVQAELERSGELEQIGGMHELTEISSAMPIGDPEIARYHFNLLAETLTYRKAHALAKEAAEAFLARQGSPIDIASKLAEIGAETERKRESLGDQIDSLIEDLERSERPERFGTGIGAIDHLDAGLGRGDLLTIAAPTSGGKSILLLQIALKAAQEGKKVLIFSLEMPPKKILRRMLANYLGRAVRGVSEGLNKGDMDAIVRGISALKAMPMHIEPAVRDMDGIEAVVREFKAKGKCDLVIVDYVQLVHLREMAKNETREQHVSEIVRRLKQLALQLDIAVATASQLNDEGKLRESRAIGMHSDHVWIIKRGEDGDLLSMDKVRDGERGVCVPLVMQGALSRFAERAIE
jgi:replicative DNA helicase